MFNVGDKVIYVSNFDGRDPIVEATISKLIRKDAAELNGDKENVVFLAYLWPLDARDELQYILNKRAGLKKAFDDSMKDIYELKNKITRGEL